MAEDELLEKVSDSGPGVSENEVRKKKYYFIKQWKTLMYYNTTVLCKGKRVVEEGLDIHPLNFSKVLLKDFQAKSNWRDNSSKQSNLWSCN